MSNQSAEYGLLDKIAQDAYMEVMGGTVGVLGIIANRGTVPLSVLTSLTPDEVGGMYDFHIGPAIDKLEAELLKRIGRPVDRLESER